MIRIATVFTICLSVVWPAIASAQAINTLTPQERSQGWELLFDGKTLTGWHSQAPPQGGGRGRGRAGGAPHLRPSLARFQQSDQHQSRAPQR